MPNLTDKQLRVREILKKRAAKITALKKDFFATIAGIVTQSDEKKVQQIKQRIDT